MNKELENLFSKASQAISSLGSYNGGNNETIARGCLRDIQRALENYVVILKGQSRHPYADVLHEWIEGAEIQFRRNQTWGTSDEVSFKFRDEEYRIKPKEPVYEALVRINYSDGTYDDTERYFTHEEFEQFGFPKSCEWAIETKRERK